MAGLSTTGRRDQNTLKIQASVSKCHADSTFSLESDFC